MNYEKPNMQIFMIEEEDIICTSGEDVDLGGIEIAPGVVPGDGQDSGGYH